MRRHLSPALVLSVLAIILATTAGATAASSLITGKQIKNSSITGADIKNKSLTGADFKGSIRGPQGLQGVPGQPGPMGPSGAVGAGGMGNVVAVDGAKATIPAGGAAGVPDADCPPGMTVIGTGFSGPMARTGGFVKKYGNFVGGFFMNDSVIDVDASVQAICGSGAVTAAVARVGKLTGKAAYARDVREALTAAG